jgi:hypothetical protein
MNIDPVHLAVRSTAEGAQKILNELETELAEAKARRDKILVDIGKAQAAAEKGDRRQLFTLGSLNKQDAEVGRLILSVERQIAEAKKRLDMMANQAAAARDKAPMPVMDGPERLFLVKTPNNGQIRHKAQSVEQLRARLLPGYSIHGEIFGANDTGAGGVVAAIEPTGPSMMKGLLAAFGDELIAFLAERGISGNPVKVVLPHNGREMQ